MRWLKLALISVIVAAVMLDMVSDKAEGSWLLAALWAALMHWVSGIVIIGLSSVLQPSLPERWYRLRSWESDGAIYRRVGIEGYRKALLASPCGPNVFLKFRGRRSELPGLAQFTRYAEMGHLTLLVVSAGVTVMAAMTGHWRTVLFLTVWNFPWNVYPVLLQRYTRSRLAAIGGSHRQS